MVDFYQIALGFFLGSLIALVSYNLRLLSFSGAIATLVLATIIYGFGGWQHTLPILAFFLLSSALSKIRVNFRDDVEEYFEKSSIRDAGQVLANGGLPAVIVFISFLIPLDELYFLYVVSICVAASDTWATEIGTIKKTKTYNVRNFQQIEQGKSGGVSIIGSIGALFGSLSILLSASFWIVSESWYIYFIIPFIGFLGSFYDSLLGSTLQAQYICVICKKITERNNHCSQQTQYYRGLKVFNNDLVNFVSGLMGVVTISVYLLLIK